MHISIRRGAVVALTASALFLTAACGGSSDKEGDKGASEGGGAGQKPAAAPLTEAQMKAGLLEVADLPTGWKVETAAPSEDKPKAEKPECQPLAQLMSDEVEGATEGGEREFGRNGDSAILAQQIFTYADDAAAKAFVKSVGDAVGACATFTTVQDGEKMTVTAEKLTAPQVGEEAVGLRLGMDIPQLGMKLESDVLVARQGAGMMRLAYVPMGEKPDHSGFEDLAKRGGDKFVKGAQG
ncbi:hypothetical protein [Streptomyces fradiae]|uniref:hypothetical protein n=1 Tax=Streptomyces fradiae TaxID=1906 RepID=UPI0029424353|nr:hypothetical protein [Streptomyces fradiae]WOI59493.1 hypothetical protein RYQ63_05995 [Streptomyces fradiae]